MGCVTSENRQNCQLTFHFAGIKRPKWYRSTLNLPDAALIITISSSLTAHDTIANLKKLIRKTYKIQSDKDILILYCDTIISHDDKLTLEDFNITNNSLLFIAINADIEHDLPFIESPTETKLNYIERDNSPQAVPIGLLPLPNIRFAATPRLGIRRRHTIRDFFTEVENDDSDDTHSISDISTDDENEMKFHHHIRGMLHRRNHATLLNLNLNAEPIIFRTPHSPQHSPRSPPCSPPPPRFPQFHLRSTPRQEPPPRFTITNNRLSGPPAPPPSLPSPGRTPRRLHSRSHTSFTFRPPSPPSPPFTAHIPSPEPPPHLRSRLRSVRFALETPSPPGSPQRPDDMITMAGGEIMTEELPMPSLTLNHIATNENAPAPVSLEEVFGIVTEADASLASTSSTSSTNAIRPDDRISVHSTSAFSSSSLEISNDSKKPMKGFDIIMQEDDVLVYKMPNCGHVMNKESLYQYALSVFTDHNNLYLKCPHPREDAKRIKVERGCWSCDFCTFINKDNRSHCLMCGSAKQEKKLFCDEKWEYSKIKSILSPEITEKGAINIESANALALKLAKLELFAARNVVQNECNVQKCPQCASLYFRHNDDTKWLGRKLTADKVKKIFETKCVLCKDYVFCFSCGAPWKDGHFCDSSFRSELIKILKEAEVKKIGEVKEVPSIRSCPNCCQLINHSDACKHMKCKACKTDFCFICLKPKKDGNWQCGSHSDPCPVAERQNAKTLPDSVVINKKTFKLAF